MIPEIAWGWRGAPKSFATDGLDLRDLEVEITSRDFLFSNKTTSMPSLNNKSVLFLTVLGRRLCNHPGNRDN